MKIFPAIDLYGGNAVRLFKGDYNEMTIYSENPTEVARDFKACGAEYLHTVDLEGAKTGGTPNIEAVKSLIENTGLSVQVGGGVRSMNVIEKYLALGAFRVILSTAAISDESLLKEAVKKYGEKIAVGADIRDGFIAIKGWTEKSALSYKDFFARLCDIGVKTVICTDISRDGAMKGANIALYGELQKYGIDIIASGGVSSLADIAALRELNLYGAIIGKAYYTGAIKLRDAIEAAK